MTLIFSRKGMPVVVAAAFAVFALAGTALATAAPSRAECAGEAVGAESCVADCPENQVRDENSGQCATRANESPEAQLQAAWEQAFGPLPSNFAAPGIGLPGIGVDPVTIAQAASAWAAAASTLPSVALPAPPPLPGPPPMPCVGFATPIPFVGFSTC
jgi:hypothetical protein